MKKIVKDKLTRSETLEVAEKKMDKAITAIRVVGKIGHADSYEYSHEDAKKMINALRVEVREAEKILLNRFLPKKKSEPFSFTSRKIEDLSTITKAEDLARCKTLAVSKWTGTPVLYRFDHDGEKITKQGGSAWKNIIEWARKTRQYNYIEVVTNPKMASQKIRLYSLTLDQYCESIDVDHKTDQIIEHSK